MIAFGEPRWFWALALLPVLLGLFLWHESQNRQRLERVVAARLLPKLAGHVSHAKRRFRFAATLLGLALAVSALARPQVGFDSVESRRTGRDVMVAIDTSRSMLANDLAPSRLARAKFAAQDLLQALEGDRIGLIAFAGTAFLQAPLTVDYPAVLSAIEELDTDIIPRGGTDLSEAIHVADEAFGTNRNDSRALVLITDGEDLAQDAVETAKKLNGRIRIFTVGAGTPNGSVIPLPAPGGGTEFVKDEEGKIVQSHLDESRLKAIAEATGGFYVPLEPDGIGRVLREGILPMTEQEIDTRSSRRPIERYQWPLAGAVLCLFGRALLRERRRPRGGGGLAAATACGVLLLPTWGQGAQKNPGAAAYDQGNYGEAFAEFSKSAAQETPAGPWTYAAGCAAYQAGRFPDAAKAFSQVLRSGPPDLRNHTEYNLGNTFFQQARDEKMKLPDKIENLRDAIAHYDETLKANPQHPKAATSKQQAAAWLKQLEEQQKKEEEQKKQEQQKKKGDDQKQKQDQDSQPDQNQSGDSKDSPGQSKPDKGDQQNPPKPDEKGDQKSPDQQAGNDPKPPPSPGGGDDQKADSPAQSGDQSGQKSQAGASPTPMPAEPKRDLSGNLEADDKKEGDLADAGHEAAEAEAVADDKSDQQMTAAQARALLDALKSDEDHVILNERVFKGRVLKDW